MCVMSEIIELLELRKLPDFLQASGGVSAVLQERLGLKRRWVSVNAPMNSKYFGELVEFATPVPGEIVLELLKLTNGARVASNKFVTYGVLDEKGGADFVSTPLDINVPNVYERPISLDQSALIIGGGVNNHESVLSTQEVVHYMDEQGTTHVCSIEDCKTDLASYTSVTDWLVEEFDLAIRKHLIPDH